MYTALKGLNTCTYKQAEANWSPLLLHSGSIKKYDYMQLFLLENILNYLVNVTIHSSFCDHLTGYLLCLGWRNLEKSS